MSTIFITYETFTNGYKAEILDILSLVAIVSAIFTIISKNPIISVLFLIGLFLSISSYLIILGINFIGLSYLLVYVGAVSILFLFILMLINVRVSELLSDTSNSIPLGIIVTLAFNYPVYQILPYGIASFNNYAINLKGLLTNNGYYLDKNFNISTYIVNNDEILFVTSRVWDGSLTETSDIGTIGNILYSTYSIWLVLTSIILLLAMVGAIVITIKQKKSKI